MLAQTYKKIEWIVVDDGSTDDIDHTMDEVLTRAWFPVQYIKKENGGVHTARNEAIRRARGKFVILLDSDDEYTPEAAETFIRVWNKIPQEKRDSYRSVTCLCQNPDGSQLGKPYPERINQWTTKEEWKCLRAQSPGEHASMVRTDIMKANPWPEPEGVKFVAESLIWRRLDNKYVEWHINEALRIYHTDSEDSLSKAFKTKTTQNLINDLYRFQTLLNDSTYSICTKERLKCVFGYTATSLHLKSKGLLPEYDWTHKGVESTQNKLLASLISLPLRLAMPFIRRKLRFC